MSLPALGTTGAAGPAGPAAATTAAQTAGPAGASNGAAADFAALDPHVVLTSGAASVGTNVVVQPEDVRRVVAPLEIAQAIEVVAEGVVDHPLLVLV